MIWILLRLGTISCHFCSCQTTILVGLLPCACAYPPFISLQSQKDLRHADIKQKLVWCFRCCFLFASVSAKFVSAQEQAKGSRGTLCHNHPLTRRSTTMLLCVSKSYKPTIAIVTCARGCSSSSFSMEQRIDAKMQCPIVGVSNLARIQWHLVLYVP